MNQCLQEVLYFVVQIEQNTYFGAMSDDKKKVEILVSYLQALRSKDTRRIQEIKLNQYKVLTTDINKIITQYIQLEKNNKEMRFQLVEQRRKNLQLQKQNASLRNGSREKDPYKNKKVFQDYSKVIDLFANDKLEQSIHHANSSQLVFILKNLWEYRQLKFNFCQRKNKKMEQFKQLKETSAEYKKLKRKLNQRVKEPNQIHSMYDKVLPKLFQKNEETMKLISKFPSKIKTQLQKIVNQISQLKKNLRDNKQFIQEVFMNVPLEKQEFAHKIIQSCIISYGQERLRRQSQYQVSVNFDYEEEIYQKEQKELLQNLKDKIQSINTIIDMKYKHVPNPIRNNQKQTKQLQVLQNVITVLNSTQLTPKNTPIFEQGSENQMRFIYYKSMQSRQEQLQRQQENLKKFLSQQSKLLDEQLFPNKLSLSILGQNRNRDMQCLQNVLKQNISLIINQINKYKEKNEQEGLRRVNSAQIFFIDKKETQKDQQKILEDDPSMKDVEIEELRLKIEQLQKQVDRLQEQDSKNTNALKKKEDIIKQLKEQIEESTTLTTHLKKQLEKQGGKMKNIQIQKNNLEQSIRQSKINIYTQRDQLNLTQTQQRQKLKQQLIDLRRQLNSVNHQSSQTIQKLQEKTKQCNQLKLQTKQLEQQIRSLNKRIIETEAKHVEQIQYHNNQIKYFTRQMDQMKQQLQTYKSKNRLTQNNKFQWLRIKSQNKNKEKQVQIKTTLQKQNLKQEINSWKQKVKQLQLKLQQTNKKMKLKTQQLIKLKEQQQKVLKQVQIQFNKKYNDLLGQSEQQTKQITKLTQQINQKERLIQQLQQKNQQIQANQRNIQISRFKQENSRSQQNLNKSRFTQHLFTSGDVFDEYYQEERLQLIQKLEANLKPIKKTKLIYKYDPINRANFHKYIDNHKHIVIVIKTIYSKIIAAYSEQCFNQNGTKKGNAFLMAPWNKKIYHVIKDKKGVCYDDYFLIFGNSQIRIRALESKFFTNFGLTNSFYNHHGDKIEQFVGEKEREVDMLTYELYELQFE